MTIQVFNLSMNTSEKMLQKLFMSFGVVNSLEINRDKYNGRSKGNALVEMPIEKEARQAIVSLDKYVVDGKRLAVNEYATSSFK